MFLIYYKIPFMHFSFKYYDITWKCTEEPWDVTNFELKHDRPWREILNWTIGNTHPKYAKTNALFCSRNFLKINRSQKSSQVIFYCSLSFINLIIIFLSDEYPFVTSDYILNHFILVGSSVCTITAVISIYNAVDYRIVSSFTCGSYGVLRGSIHAQSCP